MLSLHTNNSALSAQNAISRNQSSLSTSMTRLSTGYRINSAMDDAAGLQIATRLKAQSSGMAVAMRNTQNATSMMQTAEGALGEASNILVRMKDLATQASDASSNEGDKDAMQAEYDALADELTNIIGNTSFGGAKLLNSKPIASDVTAALTKKTVANDTLAAAQIDVGVAAAVGPPAVAGSGKLHAYNLAKIASDGAPTDVALAKATILAKDELNIAQAKQDVAQKAYDAANAYHGTVAALATTATGGTFSQALDFQIGASSSETMKLDLSGGMSKMQADLAEVSDRYNSFGVVSGLTDTMLTDTANATIKALQTAIESLGTVRSSLGAAANRLEHVNTNLANVSANTEAASGRIMDVDFATESASMTSNQMLLQAGTAMLKQSNSLSSMVMSLLQ